MSTAVVTQSSRVAVDVGDPKTANPQEEAAFVIAEQYTLTFKQLNYSVTTPKWMPAALTEGVPGETKQILHDISGHTSSGHTLAIIGSSGAGKTTLLDFLAMVPEHMGGERCGEVRVNGAPLTKRFFKKKCAYVTQDNRLWGALTVRENLEMAASMYMDAPAADRAKRVELVLRQMGLLSCQHVKAGNALIKGCSGGQKKRLSIAIELVGAPAILFLDEPTSGLDSAAACKIMELLSSLARTNNMLLVCSIHQPASRIFYAFDSLMLLSMGRVAYMGTSRGSLQHFAAHGHEPEQQMNPADFLLDLTNPDFADRQTVLSLVQKWSGEQEIATIDTVNAGDEEGGHASVDTSGRLLPTSTTNQIVQVAKRTFAIYKRDPATYAGRFMLFSTMSVIFGILYLDNAGQQQNIMDRVYAIVWGMAIPSYMSICALPAFSFDSLCYRKETKNGMYSALSYTIGTTICQIPLLVIGTLCAIVPLYFMVGLNADVGRFFLFNFIVFAFLFVVESLACVVAILIPNFVLGLGVVCGMLSTFFVFNGIFAVAEQIPWVLRWMMYISPHYYAFEAMMYTDFEGETFGGFDKCKADQLNGTIQLCFGTSGKDVLEAIPGVDSDDTVRKDLIILFALALAMRFAQYNLLRKIAAKA